MLELSHISENREKRTSKYSNFLEIYVISAKDNKKCGCLLSKSMVLNKARNITHTNGPEFDANNVVSYYIRLYYIVSGFWCILDKTRLN